MRMAARGCSWIAFGCSWAALGLLLGRSCSLLGRPWLLLSRSWVALGRSWAALGLVLRALQDMPLTKKLSFLEENRFANPNIAYFPGCEPPSTICQLNPPVKTLRTWAALGPVLGAFRGRPLKKFYASRKIASQNQTSRICWFFRPPMRLFS